VFYCVLDIIGFVKVKVDKRTDGEGTFTFVESFPLIPDSYKMGCGLFIVNRENER
jgi:hypothetical protein